MRTAERYRPRTLADIMGQPCVNKLRAFAKQPYSTCWMLVGEPGIGKSATALALAEDLGVSDPMVVPSNQLGVDTCKEIMKTMSLRPLFGQWNVLIIEELERLSQPATVFLKVVLASENLPRSLIVVATSNDIKGVDKALLQRFGRPLLFTARAELGEAFGPRLKQIWELEADGAPLPVSWKNWGYAQGCLGGSFSCRMALDDLQQALLERSEVGV